MFDFLRPVHVPEGVAVREFACKRGDLTVRGTEYRPAGEKLPVAVVSHGFMDSQDGVRRYAAALAGMGYAAYCFDFCGGSARTNKSDGVSTDMSVLTELRDLAAVVDYVQGLDYTDDTLLLAGCSQGGFVSALYAAENPERVSRLVLFYPALCIPDDARAGRMMFSRFDPNDLPEKFRCGPMKLGRCYPADVIGLEPWREIGGYAGPVLLLHGTKDKIVNIRYSERAAETYRKTSGDVCLFVIEKGKHGFSRKHDVTAIAKLQEFAALTDSAKN